MTVDSTYKPEAHPNGRQTHYPSQIENADGDYLQLVKVSGNGDRLVLDQGYHYTVVEPEQQTPYNYRCDLQLAAPLTSDAYLQILRKTPIQTAFNPDPLEVFDATSLEYELDIICFIQQELEGHLCDCREKTTPEYPGEPEIPELPPVPETRPECQPYACDAIESWWGNRPSVNEVLVFFSPEDVESGSYNLINYGSRGGTLSHGGGITNDSSVFDRCNSTPSYGGLSGGANGQKLNGARDDASATGEGDTMTIGVIVRSGAALGVGSGNIMGYRTPDPGGTTDIGWNPSLGTVTASAMNYNAGYEVNITVTAPELYGYDGDDNPVWKNISVNVQRTFGTGAFFRITVFVAGLPVGTASATETTNGTPLATWPVWTPDFNPPNEDINRGPIFGADTRAAWYDLPAQLMAAYMGGYSVMTDEDIAMLDLVYQRNFIDYEPPADCGLVLSPN